MKLLPITQISKQTEIPESTLRYYVKVYEKYLPSVDEGRKKRYQESAIEIFQTIYDGYQNGLNTDQIKEQLNQFPINTEFVEVQKEQPIPTINVDVIEKYFDFLIQNRLDSQQLIKLVENTNNELKEIKLLLQQPKKTFLERVIEFVNRKKE